MSEEAKATQEDSGIEAPTIEAPASEATKISAPAEPTVQASHENGAPEAQKVEAQAPQAEAEKPVETLAETKAEPVAMETAPQEPMVINMALFKELRTVQALRNCGIIPDDMTQSELLMIKRVIHAMHADYSKGGCSEKTRNAMKELQNGFRAKLSGKGFSHCVNDGNFNQLVEDYLGVLSGESEEKLRHLDHDKLTAEESQVARFNDLHKKEEARRDKYKMERDYCRNNPQVVKEAVRKYERLVTAGKYLPIGRIVALSGVVHPDQSFADDIVNDALSVVAARNLNALCSYFIDDEALKRYAANPAENETRIRALAENISMATKPLSALHEFEPESAGLDRINALVTLVSVQLHHALSQERPVENLIATEQKARNELKEAAQVALSLALHFLDEGPSMQDKRVRTIRTNLEEEMTKAGISVLPFESSRDVPGAKQKAADIARRAAEDLLQVVKDDPALKAKVETLAKAAGANVASKKLEAKSDLVGVNLVEQIKAMQAQQPTAFVLPTQVTELVKMLTGGLNTPSTPNKAA